MRKSLAIGSCLALLTAVPASAENLVGEAVVLRTLDKVTAITKDYTVKVGDDLNFESLTVSVQHCEKRPPEEIPETYVFLQIDDKISERKQDKLREAGAEIDEDGFDAVEAEIDALIAASPALSAQSRRLQTMPGIGALLAATLMALLPELGQMDRRAVAALAGLAPHARESGIYRGKRRIWGGRASVRRALYLAGLVASRHDPRIRAFRTRLKETGKPPKLAIIACARKLLTILNAMERSKSNYQPSQS